MKIFFGELSIPPRVREIAYLTVAKHNGCAYCQGHHIPLAKQAGLSSEQIALLDRAGFNSEKLTEAERAVVRFAYETSHDVAASDEALKQLKRHFKLPEIVDIAFVVAAGNFIQRIGRNFGVELER
jgi:AhpD family alkylhydroperoxidase